MAITPTVSILSNPGAAFMPDSLAWILAATTGEVGELEEIKVTHDISLPDSGTWTATRWRESAFETTEDMTQCEAWQIPVLVEAEGTITDTVTMIDSDGTSDTSSEMSQVIAADTRTQVYVDISSTATGGIPLADTFTDTNGTSIDAHAITTNSFLQSWSEEIGTADITSNYAEPQTRDGAGWSAFIVDAYRTTYDVRVYVNYPTSGTSGQTNNTSANRDVAGVIFRYTDTVNFLQAGIDQIDGTNRVRLESRIAGTTATIANASFAAPSLDTDYEVYVRNDGDTVKVWVKDATTPVDPDVDTPLIDTTTTQFNTATKVGFGGKNTDVTANGVLRGPVWFDQFQIMYPDEGAGTSTSDAISDIDLASRAVAGNVNALALNIAPGDYEPTIPIPFAQGINTVTRWGTPGTKVNIDAATLPIDEPVFAGGISSVTSRRATLRGFNIQASNVVSATVDLSDSGVLDTSTDEIIVSAELYAACSTEDPIFYVSPQAGNDVPGGLTDLTLYYVIKTGTANTIKLATNAANAGTGTAINITSLVSSSTDHRLILNGGREVFDWAGEHVDLCLADIDIDASVPDFTFRFIEKTFASTDRVACLRCLESDPKVWRYAFGFFGGLHASVIDCGCGGASAERPFRGSLGTNTLTLLNNHFNSSVGSGKNPARLNANGLASVHGNTFKGTWMSLGGDSGDALHTRITKNVIHGIDQFDGSSVLAASNIITDEGMKPGSDSQFNGSFGYSRDSTASGRTRIHNNIMAASGKGLNSLMLSFDGDSSGGVEADVIFSNNILTIDGYTSSASTLVAQKYTLSSSVFNNNTIPGQEESTGDVTKVGIIAGVNVSEANWTADAGETGTTYGSLSYDSFYYAASADSETIPDGVHDDFFGRSLTPGGSSKQGAVSASAAAPTVVNLSPADNATGVSDSVTPNMEFSEDMAAGTGTIELRQVAGDTVLDSIDAGDITINFGDRTEVTLTGLSLSGETGAMYIYIPAGAIISADTMIPFAGYTTNTDWNFTVGSSPNTGVSHANKLNLLLNNRRR